METIYLDHNSTTPIDPAVVEAMRECYLSHFANPASQHQMGQRSRQVLENARDEIAEILNIRLRRGDRLIFNSGGTESNNHALMGLTVRERGKIVVSAIEHPSILGAAEELQRRGCDVEFVSARPDGEIDSDKIRELLASDSTVQFVTLMLANNETGVLQPVSQIAELCSANQIPFHTDAVQAVGKIEVDFQALGASTMSIAAHKFHGPVGIGALAIRRGVSIQPLLYGGSQQLETRPGTELLALAVGMATALRIWKREAEARFERMREMRDELQNRLLSSCQSVVVNGSNATSDSHSDSQVNRDRLSNRLPNTLNISFPGIDRQALLMALDFSGIACSTGSACASGSSEPSPVLIAMGLDEDVISSSIRLSLGQGTTKAEIAAAADRILKSVNDLRNS